MANTGTLNLEMVITEFETIETFESNFGLGRISVFAEREAL
jgi:hypothetical protein